MSKQQKKGSRIFTRFFTLYLLVLIIPLIIIVYSYTMTSKVVKNNEIEKNEILLKKIVKHMDSDIEKVKTLGNYLANHRMILKFGNIETPYSGANTFEVVDLVKNLSQIWETNSIVIDYFVFFRKSGLVASPEMAYLIDKFYKEALSISNWDFDEFNEKLYDEFHYGTIYPIEEAVFFEKNIETIIYMKSAGYTLNSDATIMILLDAKKIRDNFLDIIYDDGYALLIDEDGKVLLEEGYVPTDIEKEKYIETSITSSNQGLTYVIGMPIECVLAETNRIQKELIYLLGISIIVGLIVLWVVTKYVSAPISQLMQRFSDVGTQKPFVFIKDKVDALIEQNVVLQQSVKSKDSLIQQFNIEKILLGNVDSDTSSFLESLKLTGPYYSVAILSFDEDDNSLKNVEKTVNHFIDEKGYRSEVYFYQTRNTYVFLFSFKKENDDHLQKINRVLIPCYTRLKKQGIEKCFFALGRVYRGDNQIDSSFSDALLNVSAKRKNIKNGSVIYFDEAQISFCYFFPMQLADVFINSILHADIQTALSVIDEIFEKNGLEENKKEKHDHRNSQLVKNEFCALILKSLVQANLESVYSSFDSTVNQILHNKDNDVSKVLLRQLVNDVCIEISNENKENTHINKLIRYINENYDKPDLSLSELSDVFKLTQEYLSKMIKDHTGLKYSRYLEMQRMKKATSLLIQTEKSIEEIATISGYYSSNTFSRAFKRNYQMSASKYREINKEA